MIQIIKISGQITTFKVYLQSLTMIYTHKSELNDPNQIKMAYNGGYKFYKTEKINIIK